jgi:hypothetical protein
VSWPLGSTATPASSDFTATTGQSASVRRIGTQCLWLLPRARSLSPANRQYRRTPSHVPHKSSRPGSRRLHAGHHLANRRAPARLIPGGCRGPPVLMPSNQLSTSRQRRPSEAFRRTVLERLPGPHLTRSCRAFSLSLTTTVFSQRSTGWFGACPRRPTPEGQHLHLLCSTASKGTSYMCTSFSVRDAPTELLLNSAISAASTTTGQMRDRT